MEPQSGPHGPFIRIYGPQDYGPIVQTLHAENLVQNRGAGPQKVPLPPSGLDGYT